MALATLFKSSAKSLLERIDARDFTTPEEKKELYAQLAASRDVKVQDVVRLVFSPDGELRRAASALLAARKDPETMRHLLAALAGKPEAARRAAITDLSGAGIGLAAQLAAMLKDKDPAVRKVAAEAALELPPSAEVTQLLARVAEDSEAGLRLKAVTRLAAAATESFTGYFERLLDDPDERIRQPAYQVIARFAQPRHLDLLLRKLPDESYTIQQLLVAPIQGLLPQAGPQGLDGVLTLLSSGSTQLRSVALKILLSLPDRAGTIRRLMAHSMTLLGWVRERVLQSMRDFGPEVLDPALALLQDKDPEVRASALTLVSGFDDPRVGPAVIPLLQDPDWWLAINAADLLGRLRHAGAVPALVQALGREEARWAVVDALARIGGNPALQALGQLVRDPRAEIRIEALTALAESGDARVAPLLKGAAESDEAKWVRTRALELLKRVDASGVTLDLERKAMGGAVGEGAPPIHRWLAAARQAGASDLHVAVAERPIMRKNGTLARAEGQPLSALDAERLLLPLLEEPQRARLERERQLDACFFVANDGRYRANLFVDRKGLNGVFRVIPDQPPTIADLGLPPDIAEIATFHQGIVIVTGPSGCGKSTTLAALVNLFNETRRSHIITLEDPVEFVHPFKNCLINQREVGRHTESYARALRAALREDPDVIVIGELRDTETVTLALNAAETGHIVLTTLNATTSYKAVDRLLNSFPHDEQAQARESLSGSLKLVIAQTLVQAAGGNGRVGCFEVLKCTQSVASLIRDNKTNQLPSIMQIGQHQGMRRFDDSLLALVREGRITPETAYLRATAKEAFEPMVSPRFLEDLLA